MPSICPISATTLRANCRCKRQVPSLANVKSVDIAIDSALVDLVSEGFDAGVALGEIVSKDMIAVPLGPRQRSAVSPRPRSCGSMRRQQEATLKTAQAGLVTATRQLAVLKAQRAQAALNLSYTRAASGIIFGVPWIRTASCSTSSSRDAAMRRAKRFCRRLLQG